MGFAVLQLDEVGYDSENCFLRKHLVMLQSPCEVLEVDEEEARTLRALGSVRKGVISESSTGTSSGRATTAPMAILSTMKQLPKA